MTDTRPPWSDHDLSDLLDFLDEPGPPGPPPAPPPVRRPFDRHPLRLVVLCALLSAVVAFGVARLTGTGQTVVERYYPNGKTINTRPADISGILARVLPAVVAVQAVSTQASPFFGRFGATQQVESQGSGMVVTSGGEVVTNAHVVEGAGSITVTLNGSARALAATVVGSDPSHDVALLQVSGVSGLPTVSFADSTGVQVGDAVLAIGNALGLAGAPTVTDGIVSAKGRQVMTETAAGTTETLSDMLQTDAAISSGNSGGPLVNASAQVIGMNTAVASSGSGTTAQNIGFAIPANTVRALVDRLRG